MRAQRYGRPAYGDEERGANRSQAPRPPRRPDRAAGWRGRSEDQHVSRDGRSDRAGATGKGPLWAKLVAVAGALITLFSLVGAATANYYLTQLTSGVETTDSALADDTKAGKAGTTGKLPTGSIDLLLLGLDTRAGWKQDGSESRADTIIILHVSASHDQAYMISIPRDTLAEIPADQKLGFYGATDKINGAFNFGAQNGHGWQGGARLTAQAINKLTGISFDGVVVIDFGGFSKIINVMGGVRMCVEQDTWSSHYVTDSNGKVVYKTWSGDYPMPNSWIHKKGCQDMPGWAALDYARQRYGLPNSDYDRQRHQQQLIRAMAKKATGAGMLTDPTKLAALVKAAGGSLKMDTHGVAVTDFVFGLKAIAGADVIALKTNSGTYAGMKIGGASGEGITPATQRLFEAAQNDTLGQFIMDNPEYLIPDSAAM